MRFFSVLVLGLLALGVTAQRVSAQSVPTTINYQGRLTDNTPAQNPVNATVPMSFAIYDAASAGTQLWLEPASGGIDVLVVNGIFNIALGGNGVAIPAATFTGATSTRYLEITMNPGTPGAEILAPRQLIGASGYAGRAENAGNAGTVTNGVYTTGSYANPSWLTSLAGTKITGQVSSAGSAFNFTGSLSGDVTGTQGATTVGRLQGRPVLSTAPVTNQVLQYNGAQWQPATLPVTGSTEYAYIYNLAAQFVTLGNPVSFDTNGVLSSGITHNAGTSFIFVNVSGLYRIEFIASAQQTSQFSVYVNGVSATGSRYGAATANSQNRGMVLVNLSAGDVIQLNNTGSSGNLNLNANTGGTLPAVNASILITKM